MGMSLEKQSSVEEQFIMIHQWKKKEVDWRCHGMDRAQN